PQQRLRRSQTRRYCVYPNKEHRMRTERTDVLVVGAGPVGLFSALQLASNGIDVTVIDRESGTAARSYACVLHQSTLGLLDQHGLIDEALEVGRRIDTI